jgi:hypothetical protein
MMMKGVMGVMRRHARRAAELMLLVERGRGTAVRRAKSMDRPMVLVLVLVLVLVRMLQHLHVVR